MQQATCITEPDYGVMFDDTVWDNGSVIPHDMFRNVRIEVELAFVLPKPLEGPNFTLFDVLAATGYVTPALEILNSHIKLDGRTIVDTISDNAAYGGLVLGGNPVRPHDVDLGRSASADATASIPKAPGGWLFRNALATRKIAPALAARCTVVIKPAELTPLATLWFTNVLIEAGVPAGVVNVIPTTSARAVSAPAVADPRLRKLSFIGSTSVGKELLAQAADGVLRTSMELGGIAPFVVFDDADLDKAVDGALAAKFRNIGQACTAANRFIVHTDVVEEFTNERVNTMRIGRGTEQGVTIGPLINESAVAKALELVDEAVERGAKILLGRNALEGVGTFFEPTVLTDVVAGSAILREEIFGPALAIATFESEEEAVRLANDTEYGLVSYVFTEDLHRGQRMIDGLETGMMGLNVGVVPNAAAPFSGVKQFGIGCEGGAERIHEYLSTKYTLIPSD